MPEDATLQQFQSDFVDPAMADWKQQGRDPSQLDQSLTDESAAPEAPPAPSFSPRVQSALTAGKWGAVAGGGLGALRSMLAPRENRNYLRDTLAGAMLGGVGAGGTAYLAKSDPFTRGAPVAKAFESGKQQLMVNLMDPEQTPGQVAGKALMAGVGELLSGKHKFGPKEQKALVGQFVQAQVPTSEGWRRRVNLVQNTVKQMQTSPANALDSLVTLQKVAPDAEMQSLAGDAIRKIRMGRMDTPEGVNAIASSARAMENKLKTYQASTSTVDALNMMKELYGAGQISDKDVAQRIGLITGRFGPQTEGAQGMRGFLQQMLARPVQKRTEGPYADAVSGSPDISKLLSRAMNA